VGGIPTHKEIAPNVSGVDPKVKFLCIWKKLQ